MAIKKFRIVLDGVAHEVEVEELGSAVSSAPAAPAAPRAAAPAPVAAPAPAPREIGRAHV